MREGWNVDAPGKFLRRRRPHPRLFRQIIFMGNLFVGTFMLKNVVVQQWSEEFALTGYVVAGCVEDGLGCPGKSLLSLSPSSPAPFQTNSGNKCLNLSH